MKIFLLYKWLLKQNVANIIYYSILNQLMVFISIISPFIIGRFIDSLIYSPSNNIIIIFALLFGALNILKFFKSFIVSRIYLKLSTKMELELLLDIYDSLISMPINDIHKLDTPKLTQMLKNDVRKVVIFCISTIPIIVKNLTLITVPTVILLYTSYFITLIMILLMVIYVLFHYILRGKMYNMNHEMTNSQNTLFSKFFGHISNLNQIKMRGELSQANKSIRSDFRDYLSIALKSQKLIFLHDGLDNMISTITQITLFVFGGIQVANGNFTIGTFTIFTSYFNMLLKACQYFFHFGAHKLSTQAASDRLVEIKAMSLSNDDGI